MVWSDPKRPYGGNAVSRLGSFPEVPNSILRTKRSRPPAALGARAPRQRCKGLALERIAHYGSLYGQQEILLPIANKARVRQRVE